MMWCKYYVLYRNSKNNEFYKFGKGVFYNYSAAALKCSSVGKILEYKCCVCVVEAPNIKEARKIAKQKSN